MKGLTQYLVFDCGKFFQEKKLMATACKSWVDYESKEVLGTKIDVVITEDKTPYKTKTSEQISNLYEKFAVKVGKALTIPVGTEITLVNPVGTVYGEYRQLLSVVADDIQAVTNGKE